MRGVYEPELARGPARLERDGSVKAESYPTTKPRASRREMPKRDTDLFDRLRRAGVRKQVAKTLSELGDDAGKQATRAGHAAVAELRALADEIAKRLPGATPNPPAIKKTSTPAATSGTRRRSTATRQPTPARKRQPSARPTLGPTRAPRGANKAKILASLGAGPLTPSQIAAATGIGTGTVSATLTKMTRAGEVTKGARGYALPE